MTRKPPPPRPQVRTAVCRSCGDLIETTEPDRDHCYCCTKRTHPVVPPQSNDDPDAFRKKQPDE